jgi:nitrile hydratase accessory protein
MAGVTDQRIANMDEQIALPRKNGELVFESPWEARAFGLAVALNERGLYPWRDFSQGLAAETATAERDGTASSYYERWLAALEKLVIARGLLTREELDVGIADQALIDEHYDHHHHHHDDHGDHLHPDHDPHVH